MRYIKKFQIFENQSILTDFLEYSNLVMDIINQTKNYDEFSKKLKLKNLDFSVSEDDYNSFKGVNESTEYEKGAEKIVGRSLDTDIFKKNVKVDNNVNLYIDLCRKCSGNCKFCIAKLKKEYIKKVKNPKDFLDKLDKALDQLKKVDPSVMIVGGEPTVDREKLIGTIDLIKKHKLRKPILVSNGSHLDQYIDYINKQEVFEHINISRHHYDDTINYQIFNSKNVPSTSELNIVINKIKDKSIVRFNTMIVDEGLNTYSEVMKFIKYSNMMNVKNISFAELSDLEGVDFYAKGVEDYTKENKVNIDEIIDSVDENSDFEMFKKVEGPYYLALIYTYKPYNMVVVFKKTDMKKMHNFEVENKDIIAELIFNTDASVSGSWVPALKELELKENLTHRQIVDNYKKNKPVEIPFVKEVDEKTIRVECKERDWYVDFYFDSNGFLAFVDNPWDVFMPYWKGLKISFKDISHWANTRTNGNMNVETFYLLDREAKKYNL